MMKVSTLMAFATFLVVGIKSSDSVSSAEERLWIEQCSKEKNDAEGITAERRELCYWACFSRKSGMMENGKLVERERVCDIMVDMSSHLRIEIKDGKTTRQLAEKCYDEANLKTEECEIAGAMVGCVARNIVSASEISTDRP